MKIETLSEEMRVLYVALTRAKEKLIITGYVKKEKQDKIFENIEKYEELNNMLLQNAKSYLEWITLVNCYKKEKMSELSIWNYYTKEDVAKICSTTGNDEDEKKSSDILCMLNNHDENIELEKNIKEKLDYKYKYYNSMILPTKMSVTEIKEIINDSNNIKSENELNNQNIEFPKPKFLQKDKEVKITNAEKGSLIHLCMQNLDLNNRKYTIEEIKEMVEKMIAKKTITQQEADEINFNKIYKFTQSKIWEEMCQSEKVEREKPFYINIPACEIYKGGFDEKILVQGVIDLYYIDKGGNLILVDFKTDYVPNKEESNIVEKYRVQLDLYKRALEKSTGQKVFKTYIYSTYLDKEIEI